MLRLIQSHEKSPLLLPQNGIEIKAKPFQARGNKSKQRWVTAAKLKPIEKKRAEVIFSLCMAKNRANGTRKP